MTDALDVQGAVKSFGQTKALAGASFAVRAGELVGLLGPNGAGKTTMIKAIAGRVELEAGTIKLFGREVNRNDKWTFIWIMGMMQLSVMFVWGQLVFGLPLLSHIPGFAVMTVFTAAAASGFGLLLATISRSRQQLSGISTIVILTMSALGGSMFPRFLMSETMQKMGLVTFNAWALDGYIKVFWRTR